MKNKNIILIILGAILAFSIIGFFASERANTLPKSSPGVVPVLEKPSISDSLNVNSPLGENQAIESEEAFSKDNTDQKVINEDQSRLVIREGEFNLVVKDVVETVKTIEQYTKSQGGWIVSSTINETEELIQGNVIVRVPVEKFDETMSQIRGLAKRVEYEGTKGEDVTEEYVDLEAKLAALQAEKNQFLEVLKQAKNVEEILKVYDQIEGVQAEINQLEGRIKYLSESAKMAKISVNVALSEEILPVPPSEVWKPEYIAKKAWQETVSFWRNVSYGVIEFFVRHLLTWIAILGILVLILWKPIKAGWKKLNEHKKSEIEKRENITPSGLSIASLICGIIGIIFVFFTPILGGILGAAALGFGLKENKKGYANAGFILGIIALVLAVLMLFSSSGIRPL